MSPSVSVVIPTLNEAARLPRLLDCLDRQTVRPIEVIVADAESSDGTASIAAAHGVRVVRGGTPSVGRNAGAAAAAGDLILFLDADTEPQDAFIATALEEFADRGLAIATPGMRSVERNVEYAIACELCNWYARALEHRSPHASGFCVLVDRRVHNSIGGFDERAMLAEDHDYARRASRLGPFGILRTVRVPVSMRRVEAEGRLRLARKYLYSEVRTLRGKQVTSIPFDYAFGQHVAPSDPPNTGAAGDGDPPLRRRIGLTLRTLDKPSTERQNDAIGLQLVSAAGGAGLAAGLRHAGAGPGVVVPIAATGLTVSALSTYIAWRKVRLERHYGDFLIVSPAVASYDVIARDGTTLARRGVDEVCELHVIGHLLRMSALARKGAEGRLLILLEAMHGMERLLDDLGDPRFAKANLVTARSDIVGTLMKMGFEEVPQQQPFDLANRLNKHFIGRLLSTITGYDRKADLDRYRLVVMSRTDFAGTAFRDELSRQIRRVERDLERLRERRAGGQEALARP